MADPVVEQDKVDIQKKVFGRWINARLPQGSSKFVTDLFYDLRDGIVLLDLVSGLTNKEIKREQVDISTYNILQVSICTKKMYYHHGTAAYFKITITEQHSGSEITQCGIDS